MKFWLLELPALIVTWMFRAYGIFIAAMTLICFVWVIGTLLGVL
jgi:hypothetical protein